MSAQDLAPLACTLDLGEMGPRLARLRRLARDGLVSHEALGHVLRLAYRPAAAAEVREIVALERLCCRFLAFDLQDDSGEVILTITAPQGVGPAAQWLFAQFLPGDGTGAPAGACCASCA